MKYYIIAGEASGDLHGSNLIRALKEKDSTAEFRAWGGDAMQSAGANVVKHYRDLAFMGFIEVLLNIRTILKNLKSCKHDVLSYQPDVLVLIDYPGFNMRIAEFAKQQNLKVVWYIAPQVWAWKENRVHKLKRNVNSMLTILPFEKDFFAKHNMNVDFVGHPLLDAVAERPDFNKMERLQEFGLKADKKVVALLPGSRKQEIKAMLPIMEKAAMGIEAQLVIAGAPSQNISFYKSNLSKGSSIPIIENRTYDLLEIADAALVTSGTATLETAMFNVPEVVCYRGNWFSYLIAKQLVKIKYISLVNLIMDREIVTELIQNKLNVKNLRKELQNCLSVKKRTKFLNDYNELITKLGGAGASHKAAQAVYEQAK